MATDRAEPGLLDRTSASSELGEDWRRLTRRATAIALVMSPAPFVWLHSVQGYSLAWSLAATFFIVVAFRGAVAGASTGAHIHIGEPSQRLALPGH